MLVHKFPGFFYIIFLLAALFPLAQHAYPGHNITGSTGHGMSMHKQMRADVNGMCTRLALLSIIRPDSSSLQTELAKCRNAGGKTKKTNGNNAQKAGRTGKSGSAGTRGGRGNQRNGTRSNSGKSSAEKKPGKGNTGKSNKGAQVAGASSAGKKPGRVDGSALVAGSFQNELGNHQVLHPVEGHAETSGPGGPKPESGKGKKQGNKKTKVPGRQQIADSGQKAYSTAPAVSTYNAVSLRRSKRQSGAPAPVCVNERNIIEKLKENPRGHFIQTEDIDMEKAEIAAGLYRFRFHDTPAEGLSEFSGTYDGGGHKLKHMFSDPGLFSRLNGATIKHLDLINDEGSKRGRAFGGLEAGLLAGESADSTFSDISIAVAQINLGPLTTGHLEDAEPHSGVLVGRSNNSVYEDIRAVRFTVGINDYPVSGALVGSGENNRFSNIYLGNAYMGGVERGLIIGSGENNTIDGCVIDNRGGGYTRQLVGSGNGTSVSRCLIFGTNPPYFPEGTVADEVIGYRRLSSPATFSIGTFSETDWRLDPGLIPIPRMQDKNINAVRERFRSHDAPLCNQLACPPPVASDCREPTEEMYEGQVQDFLSFDDKNIYLLVKGGNNTADHLKYMPGNHICSGDDTGSGSGNNASYGNACPSNNTISDNNNDGDDNACGTDRLKSDGCAVNQLSYLSRRGVTVHDTAKNNDNGRIYLIWKRTQTEGNNAFLASYGNNGEVIDVLAAGYGHVFTGEDFSLQYHNNRTVLVSRNQAFVIVGEGSSPVELPAHPSLMSYVYGKAIIDDNNGIYLLADARTEEGEFRSLIKYSENNNGEYEIDPSFIVQSQFTPGGLQFFTQQSPQSAGILVDNDIWVINQDRTGFHIRSVNSMSGEYSGIDIDQYVTEPSRYTLKLANDEVQLAYVDGEEVLWHSYNKQGGLIDSASVRLEREAGVKALDFKNIAEGGSVETIYVGGVNTTDNRPYATQLTENDFTAYTPRERPVTQSAETTTDYFTIATPDSTTATPASTAGTPDSTAGIPASTAGTPASTAGTPASTAGTPASTAGTPGDTPTTPDSTLHTNIIGGVTFGVVGLGLCISCGAGTAACCNKCIKKRRLMRREDQRPAYVSTSITARDMNFNANTDMMGVTGLDRSNHYETVDLPTDKGGDANTYMEAETAFNMENLYETVDPPTGNETGHGDNMTDGGEAKRPLASSTPMLELVNNPQSMEVVTEEVIADDD